MKHTIIYDEDHQLLIQTIIGDFTTEEAEESGTYYKKLLAGKPYRQLIVDLENAGKMENRETRAVANKILDEAKITDVAYVGASSAQRMIAKVLMKLGSLKAEANFVKKMDDAITWIKKRRK